MKKWNDETVIRWGNRLFRWRRWIYLVPVALILWSMPRLSFPFGSHFCDEIFEFLSFGIILLGIVIRFSASGSSQRGVIKKKNTRYFRLQTQGIFSIVRNPYFIGEFFIMAGLSLPLWNVWLFTLSLVIFLLFYLPILYAREKILLQRYKQSYQAYSQKVHLFIPSLRSFEKGQLHFRWMVALQKEAGIVAMLGVLCFCIEQIREFAIKHAWESNPVWFVFLLPALLYFLLSSSLDPSLRGLPDVPEFPD